MPEVTGRPVEDWMSIAFSLAESAATIEEVPVGAVIVRNNHIISTGLNLKEKNRDATAHAEIVAIRSACKKLQSWRLNGCHLYVTLEPCAMCAGAISQARIEKVTFAAKDPKGGGFGSVFEIHSNPRLNHAVATQFAEDQRSAELLSDFFRRRRN